MTRPLLDSASLPAGFDDWIRRGARTLSTARSEVGVVEIFGTERLGVTRYTAESTTAGTVLSFTGVELVARAERMYPSCLVWFPQVGQLGGLDFDHDRAVLLPPAGWEDVVENPNAYVNALREADGVSFEELPFVDHEPARSRRPIGSEYPVNQIDLGPKFALLRAGPPARLRLSPCDRPAGAADSEHSALTDQSLGLMNRHEMVSSWVTPELKMRHGTPTDLLASNAADLHSAGLRRALERIGKGVDNLQWLPVTVVTDDEVVLPYFVLHIFGDPDPSSPITRPSTEPSVSIAAAACVDLATSGCTGLQFNAIDPPLT